MEISTVLLILLAAIVSLCLVLFQYFYRAKKGKLQILLSFLRFLVLFSAFLLLINPKFTKKDYTVEKVNLIIAADNSASIKNLSGMAAMTKSIDMLRSSTTLSEKFQLRSYVFGNSITESDSLSLEEKTTNLSAALTSLNEVYDNAKSALVLLSDGNQTLGLDYEYLKLNSDFQIFPVVVGDTTRYEDVRIERVNANKYAFLKNKFPVEASISYSGKRAINSVVKIYLNGKQVFRQALKLTSKNSNTSINTLIEANSVGIKSLKIEVDRLPNEKNIINNSKELAIEVIDEKTNVAIVTSIMHPDVGTLKKAIAFNEQREVQILKPSASQEELENSDVFILYQPNASFKSVYDFIAKRGGGTFTITGSETDWKFLNGIQANFSKESFNQTEEILPVKNHGFSLFNNADLSLEGYPPLESELGDITVSKPFEAIASQRIKGVDLDTPLFLVFGDEQTKEAVLFGENIWKWRMQTYRNERSFKSFDDFIGKLLLYLSNVKQKSRLTINYENLYDGNTEAKITATFVDKSYIFDANANLVLKLIKNASNFSREIPMLLKGNNYVASLEGLEAGVYNFTVSNSKENISKTGSFKILDFNLEDQFLAADYRKLNRLAQTTNGALYYPNELDKLIQDLESDTRFTPIQKSNENIVSLIDFRYLLALMVLALAAEWFIRKYNGLL